MATACAFARPNTFSVGSPATTSRKWPASRSRVRNWRSMRSRVVAPTSAMNSGISGIVNAMIAAEIQSPNSTATITTSGHDHREEQLRQIQREVAVERVDPARGEDRQLTRALLAGAIGAERRDACQQRGAQLRLRARRGAARSELGRPGERPRAPATTANRTASGVCSWARPVAAENARATTSASSHACATISSALSDTERDRDEQERAGRARVPEQSRIERSHDAIMTRSASSGSLARRSPPGAPRG